MLILQRNRLGLWHFSEYSYILCWQFWRVIHYFRLCLLVLMHLCWWKRSWRVHSKVLWNGLAHLSSELSFHSLVPSPGKAGLVKDGCFLPRPVRPSLFESQSKASATDPELESGVERGLCLQELCLVLGSGWARKAGVGTETKFQISVISVVIEDWRSKETWLELFSRL